MLFEAPEVIRTIKDIEAIFNMNDVVESEIDIVLTTMENDVFIESSSIEKIKRFEKILGITAQDTETIEDRRFRVKIANNEQLPYSYRVIVNKLNTMCGTDGYILVVGSESVVLKVMLTRKSMFETVKKFAEEVVPLNMLLNVDYMYNQYSTLGNFTYNQLSAYTYEQLRNEVLV